MQVREVGELSGGLAVDGRGMSRGSVRGGTVGSICPTEDGKRNRRRASADICQAPISPRLRFPCRGCYLSLLTVSPSLGATEDCRVPVATGPTGSEGTADLVFLVIPASTPKGQVVNRVDGRAYVFTPILIFVGWTAIF